MATVEELRHRLLHIVKQSGVSMKLAKLNNHYTNCWQESINTSYQKITKVKRMHKLKKSVKEILGSEAGIHKGSVYLKGFLPNKMNQAEPSNAKAIDTDFISLVPTDDSSPDLPSFPTSFLTTICNTTSKCAERNLKKSLKTFKGGSKDTAIAIDDEDDIEDDNNIKVKETETSVNKTSYNVADSFEQYRSFQQIHAAYCKLRIVAMIYSLKRSILYVNQFKVWFKEIYRENFFSKNVLKYYVSETNSHFQYPELFLQRFCADFIRVSEEDGTRNTIMTLISDAKPLFLKLLHEMICLLEKLELPDNFINENHSVPPEITLLGNVDSDEQPVDVLRIPDKFGNHHKMFFFPCSNINRNLSIKERPTLTEINEKVTQIQNKICRRGDAVRVVEIIKELCFFYNVSCIKDLCPLGSRPLRQESDIPAIFNILRLQGKINAFIQSFVTFRNICTLYELNQEICKLESKSSFTDYKLGPLQKQVLVYDYFQFPPNKEDIPQITTFDVFRLIWKLENDRYHDDKKKGNQGGLDQPSNCSNRFTLTEFMDFFIKQHGFAEPYECGVRIASLTLAISLVKKGKFGDFHHEKEMIKKFNDHLRQELDMYLSTKLREIVGTNKVINHGEPQNLLEKVCGMKLLDAFSEIYLMLQHMKQEACKKLPHTANLINFSDITMNALLVIQKDPLMSSIFHILLSTAPLKVLGMNDVAILSYLGFEETIKQMVEKSKKEATTTATDNHSIVTSVPKALVTQTTKNWLSQNKEISLDSLSRIERQVIASINGKLQYFEELGHGSFLKFLTENESIKELVDYNLKSINESTSEAISKDDLTNFIHQCGDQKNKDDISSALKIQFNLKDSSSFIAMMNENSAIATDSVFLYQHAVLCATDYQKEISIKSSKEDLSKLAVSKINALPYLQEISKFTNWDEIFKKKLGSLKTFIKSNFNLKDICYFFLEVEQGKFMKVIKDCSIDLFSKSLAARDAKLFSLYLTSILCLNGRLEHAPLALLSNLIQTSMLTDLQTFSERCLLVFVLDCFLLIPFDLLCCIIRKMFLSPLSTIYGSMKVPSLLLRACNNNSGQRSRLHALGFQLFIAEWMESYKEELDNVVKDSIHSTETFSSSITTAKVETKFNEEVEVLQVDKSDSFLHECKELKTDIPAPILCQTNSLNAYFDDHAWFSGSNSVQTNSCKQIINDIRQEQFGIGLEFGEQEMKLIEVHREREGRSLQRLSNELYSKDSHFVLELIQNADDNDYPERIRVLKTIDLGCHRKKHCQKGIGFKSVFRITDAPEIHSNGYHIKFDASSGSNGYILPHWIDDWETQSRIFYPFNKQNYTWMTQIVLPLKKEMQHTKLISRFHDIHSSLLLFLNRLHTIIIDDKVSNIIKVIERENVGDNLVRLSNNNDVALWLVVGKEFPINVREDVNSTNLAVAFPLDNNLKAEACSIQPIFAYLPLRSYGFKFVIQADFEVPSSREDIDKDSAWNQCILQHLPRLVIEAFHSFKFHQHFNGLDGIIEYFKFMDLEDHVLGIFKQVSCQIIKSLQQEACLPVMPKDGKSSKEPIVWAIPSCIIHSQEHIVKVISQNMLEEKLGLFYLNKDVDGAISKRVLTSLGVRKITLEQLLEICRAVVHQFNVSVQSEEETKLQHQWIGKWLHLVYNHLQEQCDCSEKTLNALRSLQIYPMTDGSMKSLNDHVIFFPIYEDYQTKFEKVNVRGNKPIHLIEKDLHILSHSLVLCLGGISQQQVKKLLCDLGVKDITPSDVIQNHIIPTFKTGNWKTKSEELIVAYVGYLHEQYMLHPEIFDITEAIQWIVLLTNKGFQSPADSSNPIYLTPQYGNEIDLKMSFPSVDWTLVSDCYLTSCSETLKGSLQRFFISLSVQKFFMVRKLTKLLHISDLIGSCWDIYFKTWPQTIDDKYIIHDLDCLELNQIIDSEIYGEISNMVVALDQRWNAEFSKYDFLKPGCVVKNCSGEVISSTFSSFLLKMRTSAWLPNNKDKNSLHYPRDLFVNNDRIVCLLGDKVNYLTKQVKSKNFIFTLGVQTEINFKSFVKEFKKWREESLFITNYIHTKTIYRYFQEQSSDYDEIINELKKGPFVFLLSTHCKQMLSDLCAAEGKFFPINRLCWEDPSGILCQTSGEVGQRRILKGYYPDEMQSYFVSTLGVSRYPSVQEYINLACSIAYKTNLPDKEACENLFTIFSVLGQMLISDKKLEELQDWSFPESSEERKQQYEDLSSFIDPRLPEFVHWKEWLGESIFPTSKNQFCCMSDLPLLVDNKNLARIFIESEKVPLIFFDFILNMIKPKNSLAFRSKRAIEACDLKMIKILVFFKACRVQLLSNVYIEPEVITVNMKRGCEKWEKVLHEISPIIQRYLCTKFPEHYNELRAKCFHEYLKNTTLFSVQSLEAVYRLFDRNNVNITHTKIACVSDAAAKRAIIYITSQYADEKAKFEQILSEILTLFVGQNEEVKEDLLDFVQMYLVVPNKSEYLKRKNVAVLPSSDVKWHYPEPNVLNTSVPTLVTVTPSQNSTYAAVESGGLMCWPPRNPGSYGVVPKPDFMKYAEEEINEKWKPPENPTITENVYQVDNRLSASDLSSDGPEYNRKRKLSEPGDSDYALMSSKKPYSGLSHPDSPSKYVPVVEDELISNYENPRSRWKLNEKFEAISIPSVSSKFLEFSHEKRNQIDFTLLEKYKLEEQYEDLPILLNGDFKEDLQKVNFKEKETDSKNPFVGKIGENLVYQHLREIYKDDITSGKAKVIWLNEAEETGDPYDLKIEFTSVDQNSIYIEVKTSYLDGKKEFEISANQLRFAFEQQACFHLYRVTGINGKLRIRRLVNLSMYMDCKSVRLFMLL